MARADDPAHWFGESIDPGERRAVSLTISESYSGQDVSIPVYVWRGAAEGPTVLITAAVHGDEINGTGCIRKIIREAPFELRSGTLVLVPVVNMPGFERHTRYLPDRRDLNRSFPGTRDGSFASRLAWPFFQHVVKRCRRLRPVIRSATSRSHAMAHSGPRAERDTVSRRTHSMSG